MIPRLMQPLIFDHIKINEGERMKAVQSVRRLKFVKINDEDLIGKVVRGYLLDIARYKFTFHPSALI